MGPQQEQPFPPPKANSSKMKEPQEYTIIYNGGSEGAVNWDVSMIQMMEQQVPQDEIVEWQMILPA